MKQHHYTKCLALLFLLIVTSGAKSYGQHYTMSNAKGTQIISAKLYNYDTLTYIAGANGSITGTLLQLVEDGGSGTAVTAVPNTDYSFKMWSDGSTINPRTDVNVTASMHETAYFSAIVPPYVRIDTNNISFNSSGGSFVVDVSSNTNWTATTNNNWLNVAFDSTGDGAITITCAQNSSTAARSGCVVVSGGGGTIAVTQLPAISYDNKTMTININGHSSYQVHDFISDTLNKLYSSQASAIYSALLAEGYKLGYYPSASVPQSIPRINVSLGTNNTGSVTICLSNFELDFDEGTGYCDPREYINFGINISANLQLVADSFAYKLNITNAQVSLGDRHFSAGFQSGHKFWCYLDPFADIALLVNDLVNLVLPDAVGWFTPTTYALSNTSIPLFKYAQVCPNMSAQDVQGFMNSFPMNFTLSNDESGNIVLGMNFMQGTVPGDNSFTQYNPSTSANPSFDYMGFGCPYYSFQGAFQNWTANKPAGDSLALATLLLNSMHSFATPSVRISLPWKNAVGDLPTGSMDTITLTPAALNAAIQAIPERNWASTDSIINLAQKMGFDVIPQLTQQESDVATMNGKTMAPDNNNGTGEPTGYSYVNGNTYLYYLKIFAHAAVRRYQNKISIWAIEAELNAAKYAQMIDSTRHGNLWKDQSTGGFQDKVWRILKDAVRQEDPTAKLTTALHMINMVSGLQRFAPDCDIVGVNVYPNSYFAVPVMGFAVGEMVWATRRALLGLNIKNSDGSEKIIHVTETNYPALYQNDPPSNISLNSNLTYYSWGRQSQYMTDAITTSMNNGAKGFFWWGFLDHDIMTASELGSYADYGSLIVRNSNPIQYKTAAATFQGNANTTGIYPGKSLVTLTNRSVANPNANLGGLVAVTAERDSLHSGDSVYTTKNRAHISQTYQQRMQGLKHQNWDGSSSDFLLKQSFSPSLSSVQRTANFTSTQPASFNLTLLDIGGNSNGTISYKDPWYVNSSGSQPNAFRDISLSPGFSDNVFTGQTTNLGTYYSVSAPATQTINNFTSYFQGWTKSGATLADSTSATTAVVFNNAGATVTAKYKAHLASTVSAPTRGGGQQRIASADGSEDIVVYSSAGEIWATSHDYLHDTWTPEVRLSDGLGGNSNPSIATTGWSRYASSPIWETWSLRNLMTVIGDGVYVVWEKQNTNGTYDIYFAMRNTDARFVSQAWAGMYGWITKYRASNTPLKVNAASLTYEPRPVVSSFRYTDNANQNYEEIAVVLFNTDNSHIQRQYLKLPKTPYWDNYADYDTTSVFSGGFHNNDVITINNNIGYGDYGFHSLSQPYVTQLLGSDTMTAVYTSDVDYNDYFGIVLKSRDMYCYQNNQWCQFGPEITVPGSDASWHILNVPNTNYWNNVYVYSPQVLRRLDKVHYAWVEEQSWDDYDHHFIGYQSRNKNGTWNNWSVFENDQVSQTPAVSLGDSVSVTILSWSWNNTIYQVRMDSNGVGDISLFVTGNDPQLTYYYDNAVNEAYSDPTFYAFDQPATVLQQIKTPQYQFSQGGNLLSSNSISSVVDKNTGLSKNQLSKSGSSSKISSTQRGHSIVPSTLAIYSYSRVLTVKDTAQKSQLEIMISQPKLGKRKLSFNAIKDSLTTDNCLQYLCSQETTVGDQDDTLSFKIGISGKNLKSSLNSLACNMSANGKSVSLVNCSRDAKTGFTRYTVSIPVKNYKGQSLKTALGGLDIKSVGKNLQFSIGHVYALPAPDTITSKKQQITATEASPVVTGLTGNYPNPFNPTTTISYQLQAASKVSLKIYDVLGREIVTLVSGDKPAGVYNATFDGSRFASGMYFARFIVNSQSGKQIMQVKKMLMLK